MNDNEVKIIVAIIGLIGTIVGGLFSYFMFSKKQAIQEAKREQNQKDNFDLLFKELKMVKIRLDSHNGYAEKFAESSKNIAVMAEKQESLNKAVERLQKDIDYLKSDRCKV